MKDRLIFDTTDADTRAATDNVGAYLRASDGTLLTHTDVGGKKALDVRVAEGINVEVDLDAADDSVASWTMDGAGNAIGSTGGYLHVLAQQDTSPWVIGDGGGSITVDASDLDIRDLTAASDSVASWTMDGTGTAITSTVVGADTGLDVNIINSTVTVNDAALANTAIAAAANSLAVADTAEDVVASPLANRKYLWIYNNDNTRVFVGQSGVSAASGFPVSPGSYLELRAGAAVDIEFVGQAGKTPEIRTLELS